MKLRKAIYECGEHYFFYTFIYNMVISSVKIAAFSTGPFIFFSQERSRVNSHVDNGSFDTQYNNLQLDGNTRPVVTRMITNYGLSNFWLLGQDWETFSTANESSDKGLLWSWNVACKFNVTWTMNMSMSIPVDLVSWLIYITPLPQCHIATMTSAWLPNFGK